MKYIYKEKADLKILDKCKKFIHLHSNTRGNYEISTIALNLYDELLNSLLASHKEFENAILKENAKILFEEDGIKLECLITKYNNTEFILELDAEAQSVLKKLEDIENNNKR